MRGPFTLVMIGFAAMFGPLVGASMPWAPRLHAWLFGAPAGASEGVVIGQLGQVAPHIAFAFTGVLVGIVIAWLGMAWACCTLMRHGWLPGKGE